MLSFRQNQLEELLLNYWLQIAEPKSETRDDSEICPVELFEKYETKINDIIESINEGGDQSNTLNNISRYNKFMI